MRQSHITQRQTKMTNESELFYFYAYYRNPKITIHRGECRFCNRGQGMQPNKIGGATGRWRGAYPSFELSLEAAQVFAQTLGVEPTVCQRCRPDSTEEALTEDMELTAA
ncbi:hypothetical protein GCM10028805_08930 [Spirosoma harenae]